MSLHTTYQPLDRTRSEIRLIEILSDGDAKPRCRLNVVSLVDKPQFAALSYVWGCSNITEDILLDDQNFPITVNLADALKYVKTHWCNTFPDRDPGLFRLWADAVCVNQHDQDERSSQVKLMRSVYSDAEVVLSWLGYGIDDIDLAFEVFSIIPKETMTTNNEELTADWLKDYPSLCAENTEDGFHNKHWNGVERFFKIPYWNRVWIFQELVLGKHVLLLHGSTALSYSNLERTISWIELFQRSIRHGQTPRPPVVSRKIWDLLYASLSSFTVSRVLFVERSLDMDRATFSKVKWSVFSLGSTLQATDSRDHVYGLLGLTDCTVTANYNKDIFLVLQDFVNAWVQDTCKLDCIRYAGVGIFDLGSCPPLPSWAPNFSFRSHSTPGRDFFTKGHADRNLLHGRNKAPALTHSILHVSSILGPALFKVHGCLATETWTSGSMYEFTHDFVSRSIPLANRSHPLKVLLEVIMNEDIEEFLAHRESMVRLAVCFFQCLILEQGEYAALLGAPLDCRFPESFFDIFFPGETLDKDEFLANFNHVNYWIADASAIFQNVKSTQIYFRYTEIEHGYFGLTPRFSRPGDLVAILKGCNVPVVLRKHGDYYILVGTCFVPGLMEGEAQGLLYSGRAKAEEIRIR